jgi:hypothetical protein
VARPHASEGIGDRGFFSGGLLAENERIGGRSRRWPAQHDDRDLLAFGEEGRG